jgi:hypothetical protein
VADWLSRWLEILFERLIEFHAAPVLALGVSAAYFLLTPSGSRPGTRFLTSAHGASLALIYCAAFGAQFVLGPPPRWGGWEVIFRCTLALPVSLALVSFVRFKGPGWVHLLQLVNLACLAWTAFAGGIMVRGFSWAAS